MGAPHVLVVPFPVLGILNPLMQFSQVLAKHGCKITFVTTEFSHQRFKLASEEQENSRTSNVNLVSLPDGLDPEDDRKDLMKMISSIRTTMPAKLQMLIEDTNAMDAASKISCIVVSMNTGWALEVAQVLGIKGAVFFTASATSLATCDCIQRLIDDGLISSEDGLPIKNQKIQLSPIMPLIDPSNLAWCSLGKIFFDQIVQEMQIMKLGECWLCNTSYELEPGAFSISPKFLPIGPIIATSDQNKSSFWEEDKTCLDWLNQQPPQSVIYVSFGSLAEMDANQFKELAVALEILNMPFLWVVRPDDDNRAKNSYPEEFQGSKGKIVSWAPQKRILNHPALACFISHCGWNSTIEGLSGGVPFLCWPFFSDQFLNKSYICDVWKVGLGFEKDESGLISRDEVTKKVEQLVGDNAMKARALELKEIVMNSIAEDGHSSKNISKFINWAKE